MPEAMQSKDGWSNLPGRGMYTSQGEEAFSAGSDVCLVKEDLPGQLLDAI